ncbi:MAG TPA: hypothetical protein VGN07_10925 [Steroidobacteraceae bacterium]|jgi:hypothetical protein
MNSLRCVLLAFALHLPASGRAEGLISELVRRFAESDFELVRASSNAPFPPLAALTATGYQQSEFRRTDGADTHETFEQDSLAQYALVPIPLGRRDAIVVGEWLSWTRFELSSPAGRDIEVLSAAVPVGWIRQASADWQLAAFVAPLGHRTDADGWYWETLGGVFARNLRSERFAWIVGMYFDVSSLEDFYTPYLGATYIANDRWTLNAVMPWPSITYAPSPHTLFRFGVSPSGASWSVEPGERRPRMNLLAWNVGFSVERRIFGNFWLGVEVGASCLRGLSIVGNDWEPPETRLDGTGFALVSLTLRPSSQPP